MKSSRASELVLDWRIALSTQDRTAVNEIVCARLFKTCGLFDQAQSSLVDFAGANHASTSVQ